MNIHVSDLLKTFTFSILILQILFATNTGDIKKMSILSSGLRKQTSKKVSSVSQYQPLEEIHVFPHKFKRLSMLFSVT